jgi:hypothetical protein
VEMPLRGKALHGRKAFEHDGSVAAFENCSTGAVTPDPDARAPALTL